MKNFRIVNNMDNMVVIDKFNSWFLLGSWMFNVGCWTFKFLQSAVYSLRSQVFTLLPAVFFCLPFFLPVPLHAADAKQDSRLIIFHAGSMSVPLKKITEAFNKKYPDIKVVLESAGSRECARKVIDLKKECDMVVSADYAVIDTLLIPEYAAWEIRFASTQISIVYDEKSKYSNEINSENWYKILQKPDVVCGASEPNSDPCGYRTVLAVKLSQIYYGIPDLYKKIMEKKDGLLLRPKEVDLLSLLESNNIDYVFLYKPVAIQHDLKYVELPPQINLSSPEYSDYYSQVSVRLSGSKPGTFIEQKGEPILYGLTILKNAVNKDAALKYVKFMLTQDEGIKIMQECGMDSVVPSATPTYSEVPVELKQFAK